MIVKMTWLSGFTQDQGNVTDSTSFVICVHFKIAIVLVMLV